MSTTPPPIESQSAAPGDKDESLAFSGAGMIAGVFIAPVMLLANFPRMFRLYSMAPIVRIAIIIILFGMALLVGNEVYSALKAGRLGDLQKTMVAVVPDAVDASHDGRVVQLTGVAKSGGPLVDPDLKISIDALRVVRKVEMLQWKETKGTKPGDPSSYDKTWSEKAISSIGFQDHSKSNPPSMPLHSDKWSADPITVGAFTLAGDLAAQIDANQPMEVTKEMLAQLPDAMKADAKLDAPFLYLGADPGNTHVGDVRISYIIAPAGQTVSVAATQHGNRLGGGGSDMEVLKVGSFSADQLVAQAQGTAATIAWGLRALGALIIYGGLTALFRTTAIFGDMIMMAGNLITLGMQTLKAIFAVVLAAISAGLAWGVMHPLPGSPIVAVVVVLLVLGFIQARKRRT